MGMRRSEKVLKKKREDFQNEEKSFERIIMCEHGSNHGSRMRRKQQRDNSAADNSAAAGTEEAAAPAASGDTIALRVWAAEEDQTLTNELIEQFKEANPDQTFDITVGVESEANAKDDILVDPTAAADVFAFASDQLIDLVDAGVLQAVQDVDTVSSQNVAGAVEAATVDGTLYAYPMSADNG